MAGKRKFDEEKVLDAVMRTFWTFGWRAASMDALADAAGLQKGSLQNAYGNKEALFLLAIERYGRLTRDAIAAPEALKSPVSLTSAYLDAIVARAEAPGLPDGCLTTFGCMEREAMPEKAAAAVVAQFGTSVDTLSSAFDRFQRAGSLLPECNPRGLAASVVAATRGIVVFDKVGRPSEEITEIRRHALILVEAFCPRPDRSD